MVDIPVVALGEASMLYGCQLGQHSGIVTINRRYISWFHHQIAKYGLEQRVAGVHAMTFEPGQILQAYEWDALAVEVVRLFAEQARPLVAAGRRCADSAAAAFRCCCSDLRAVTRSMARRSSTASRSWSRSRKLAVRLKPSQWAIASVAPRTYVKPPPEIIEEFMANPKGL